MRIFLALAGLLSVGALVVVFLVFGADDSPGDLGSNPGSVEHASRDASPRRSNESPSRPVDPVGEAGAGEDPGPPATAPVALRGRVVDTSGLPVPGARLRVGFERHPTLSPDAAVPGDLKTVADSEGRFLWSDVPAGWRFRVAASAPGMRTSSRGGFIGSRDVDLGDLAMAAGVALTGRVVDARGAPASGVPVDARRPSSPTAAPSPTGALATTESDGEGLFRFDGLPAEPEVLLTARRGRGGFAVLKVEDLEPGERRGGLRLILPPSRSLEGTITDDLGAPVNGARIVTASVVGSVVGPWSKTYGVVAAMADASGRFVLDDLPMARIDLRVQAPGHLDRVVLVGADQKTLDVRLERSPLLFGNVLGPEGGPVESFSMRLVGGLRGHGELGELLLGAEARRAMGPDDGTWDFVVKNLTSRQAAMEVRAPGFATRTVPFPPDLSPGERRRMQIVLEREVECRGVVVDARTGKPVPGALVLVDQERAELLQAHMRHLHPLADDETALAEPSRGVRTNADGSFSLRGLRGGRHVVMAVHPDYLASPSLPFELRGAEDGLRLRLDPAASVEGVVRDAHGKPVPGAQVALFRDYSDDPTGGSQRVFRGGFGQERLRTHADDRGRFRLAGLQEGLYRVRVRGPGAPEMQQWFMSGLGLGTTKAPGRRLRIARGQALHIDLTLDAVAGVEGVVLRKGRPVPGAVVTVLSGGDALAMESPRAVTDGSGRFHFAGLQPGHALLEVAGEPPLRFAVRLVGDRTVFRSLDLPAGVLAGVVELGGRRQAGVVVVLEDLKPSGGDARGLVKAIRGMGIAETGPSPAQAGRGPVRRTGADGRFRFAGLEPGRYRLHVQGGNALEVVLSSDEEREDLVLTLDR